MNDEFKTCLLLHKRLASERIGFIIHHSSFIILRDLMGPGFKYHIVTIAAIFFALTAGLVVGSLYVSPQVADGQKRAITNLRETINKNVADQRAEIERYQKFVAAASPILIQNRLKGEPVAIVQTGDYPEATEKVRAALTQANARIVSVTHIDEAYNPLG